MFHYLFTNDLRIRNLEDVLHDAGICFVQDKVPSAEEDKNVNNNMNTLGFYFNLTKDSQCARECAQGNVRRVVLNFIKKFQFPNPRTKESFSLAAEDGIMLAPMRVILQVLYLLHMTGPAQDAYLTTAEIARFIFFCEEAAKNRQPDLAMIVRKITESRRSGKAADFPMDDERAMEQKGCFWKQCKRQLREMVKVLCWSGCVQETRKGVIEIFHESLTRDNKADLFEILTYTGIWMPKMRLDFSENKRSYQRYMDIEPQSSSAAGPALFGGEGDQIAFRIPDADVNQAATDQTTAFLPEMAGPKPEREIVFYTKLAAEYDRNRIVYGAPGTGKSFRLARDAQKFLENTGGSLERVTFHPEYSYAQFVGTYKPVSEDGTIEYRFVPGPFMRVYAQALRSAGTGDPKPHILLVEEINRARVAAVFGDIFQLLDRDEYGVSEYRVQASEDIRKFLAGEFGGEPKDHSYLRLPDNLFIWATMNSADQGVYPMDTAFKRRWSFEYIGIDDSQEKAGEYEIPIGMGEYRRYINWNRLRKGINQILAQECRVNEDKLLGPFFLSRTMLERALDDEDKFVKAFESKVMMYLFEDVMKMRPANIFKGHKGGMIFSEICRAFEQMGEEIFGLKDLSYTKNEGNA